MKKEKKEPIEVVDHGIISKDMQIAMNIIGILHILLSMGIIGHGIRNASFVLSVMGIYLGGFGVLLLATVFVVTRMGHMLETNNRLIKEIEEKLECK